MDECVHQGELLPTEIEDLFEWAQNLNAVEVREAIGVDPGKARRMKTALKVYELDAYWHQLKDDLPPESEWERPGLELPAEIQAEYASTSTDEDDIPF